MIRQAVEADIPIIAEMGALFHVAANAGEIADYDLESITSFLGIMIESPDMILLVAEQDGKVVGMAGGAMCPVYFNHAHRTGQEMFYWINPASRGGLGRSLLDGLEQAARDGGCTSWVMVALENMNPDATGHLYRKRGYQPAERNWIRSL